MRSLEDARARFEGYIAELEKHDRKRGMEKTIATAIRINELSWLLTDPKEPDV